MDSIKPESIHQKAAKMITFDPFSITLLQNVPQKGIALPLKYQPLSMTWLIWLFPMFF